jgi:hypothetical protein
MEAIVTRVRRRSPRPLIGGLTREERDWLRWGTTFNYIEPGTVAGFLGRDPEGGFHVDEKAAGRAWKEHRDEMLAEAAPFIPFAARRFEGMAGDVSPYEHLRAVHPEPAS